jgi:pimeloyl-ACP methyl ester carboxylesterase
LEKMTVEQRFADNQGLRIEYLVWEPGSGDLREPALLVPGMGNPARDWAGYPNLHQALGEEGPRRRIAVSLRGRGESDAPESGWTPAHHHSDMNAVLDAEGIKRAFILGWSTGAAFALGFSLDNPDRVAGLAIGDFPPFVPQYGPEWAEMIVAEPAFTGYHPDFPRRYVAESEWTIYTKRLPELSIPVVVLRGTRDDAILQDPKAFELYRGAGFRLVELDCGHDVFAHPAAVRACAQLVEGE